MGLFSSSTQIQVSSVLYNLAGEPQDSTTFLDTTLFTHVTNKATNKGSYSDHLRTMYQKGPGITQRKFFNWARNSNYFGLSNTSYGNAHNIDPSALLSSLPDASPLQTQIQSVDVVQGNHYIFAEKYILENHISEFNTDWTSDYLPDSSNMVISFADGSQHNVPLPQYNQGSTYIVAYYYNYSLNSSGEADIVDTVTDSPSLPDLDLFTETSNEYGDSVQFVLETKEDGVVTSTETVTFIEEIRNYEWEEYLGGGSDGENTNSRTHQYIITEKRRKVENTLDDGVDTLEVIYDWTYTITSNQEHVIDGGYNVFIYEVGSGILGLDAMVENTTTNEKEFYPIIPLRLHNSSITDVLSDEDLSSTEMAYRMAFNSGSLDEILTTIEDNPSIGDIDHAYISFGVPLNTEDASGKEYIYKFFDNLRLYQIDSSTRHLNNISTFNVQLGVYNDWLEAQSDSSNPLFGTPRPAIPVLNPTSDFFIEVSVPDYAYNTKISWLHIQEDVVILPESDDHGLEEYWLESSGSVEYINIRGNNIRQTNTSSTVSVQDFFILKKISDTTAIRLTVYGARHDNLIYSGKSVRIQPMEALADTEASGFLIPLHSPTVEDMGLVGATQLATSNAYIIFNSYTVVKRRWYQSGVFRVLFVIAIIIIAAIVTVVTGGVGTAGVLGAAGAVGASLGFAGTAALIVGSIANSLAALVIGQVLSVVSVELLGETIGPIVAAVINIVLVSGVSDITSLLTAGNLITLSSGIATSIENTTRADTEELWDQYQITEAENQESLNTVQELMAELIGDGGILATMLSGDTGPAEYGRLEELETLDDFIHRSTLTGNDIATYVLDSVYKFPEISRAAATKLI